MTPVTSARILSGTLLAALILNGCLVGTLIPVAILVLQEDPKAPEDITYVSGRVLDPWGRPLSSALVTIAPRGEFSYLYKGAKVSFPNSGHGTTDTNGYYRIAGMKPGFYNIHAEKVGVGIVSDTTGVSEDGADVTVGDLRLKPWAAIRGFTLLPPLSDTVPNSIRIDLLGSANARVTTDRDPFFIGELPARRYVLTFSRLVYEDARRVAVVSLDWGDTVDVDTVRLFLGTSDTLRFGF